MLFAHSSIVNLSAKPDTVIVDGNEAAFVEVADGFLVGFLRDLEAVVDKFGGRFVAEITIAIVLIEVTQQHFGKVEGVLTA